MSAQDAVAFARQHVGDGYIYGSTGWTCSPARREQQAKQYPEYQANILNIGAKWDGKTCWDCATFTRACAKAGGATLPSGATSQWRSGAWAVKGTIDQLPESAVAMLYRQKGEIMQHTGLYLGDGTVIDARGTKYGVMHQERNKYAWTHYAIPKGWGGTEEEKGEKQTMQIMVVTADSGSTVNLRTRPDKSAPVLAKVPIGEAVQMLNVEDGWATIQRDGVTGYMMAQYLKAQGEASPTLEERVKQLEERVAALEGGRG